MDVPVSILFSSAALIVSTMALRQSKRIARESNALTVRPLLVPSLIDVGKDQWDNGLRLKAIRNDGKGPALNVNIRLFLVVDGCLGDLHYDLNVLSVAPGEAELSECWARLDWEKLWEREKECDLLTAVSVSSRTVPEATNAGRAAQTPAQPETRTPTTTNAPYFKAVSFLATVGG